MSEPLPRAVRTASRAPCACWLCREIRQLHQAAALHPDLPMRLASLAILDAMERVDTGRAGAITLDQLLN